MEETGWRSHSNVVQREGKRARPLGQLAHEDEQRSTMPEVKYRLHGNRPAPQPIKVAVPGWAGAREPRADGSHEQPWHCAPFVESATYGIEVLYPFDEELRVSSEDGQVRLEASWG